MGRKRTSSWRNQSPEITAQKDKLVRLSNTINKQNSNVFISVEWLQEHLTNTLLSKPVCQRTWKKWRADLWLDQKVKSLPMGDALMLYSFCYLRSKKKQKEYPSVTISELVKFVSSDMFALISSGWSKRFVNSYSGRMIPTVLKERFGRSWSISWLYRKAGVEVTSQYSEADIERIYKTMCADGRSREAHQIIDVMAC